MGLSNSVLLGLKIFQPNSITGKTLEFFEFLKYETKPFRTDSSLSKEILYGTIPKSSKIKQTKTAKTQTKKQFEEFLKNLDKTLMIKNSDEDLSEIKWDEIDDFCSLLRLIERSDERKVRWALYNQFVSGNTKITIDTLSKLLKEFKINNLEKVLNKILKSETLSGLDAEFDGTAFTIKHQLGDKLVSHYLADAIEEPSRRSPGELEKEILALIDEGSYSNQEISQALMIDEGLVSRTISKLRDQDKIVLSSFGQRGIRYFTTNCDNCPFGTTKSSCRKEALSFIISAFMKDYDVDLTTKDFDSVESNQALLKIKRIIMMARKEKNTKLERNLSENLDDVLSKVVDKFIDIEYPDKKYPNLPEINLKVPSNIANLPILYQLGLRKGAQGGIRLMDEMLHLVSKSISKEDRVKIKKHSLVEANKFLQYLGLDRRDSN
ncbi:hypothetical protein [Nitrosopumilus adriaticus]|uniref:Uncharacterized protein n=1 Tax=Nitrosopumilus adriaticus TaxID=1580092 RepID=A0A0D5C1Y7_9ARCH|nr:hypothetical protein [Nitrosopumilus adriaticus]AJW70794.1 hypothetical protein NADRNF5_1104 [Nitrosopumilus adriaticus]